MRQAGTNAMDDLEENQKVTVEEIRKLALPLGTRVVAGDGLLNRAVSWTTIIYPEEHTSSKSLQRGEMILVAPFENNTGRVTSDVEVVRWATDTQAAAVVLSDSPS